MCGIVGILKLSKNTRPIDSDAINRMLSVIQHRGPDGFGVYRNQEVELGNARLSIIDLSTGDQPICNEDKTIWVVFNGEIFNYIELRSELEQRGHVFETQCDTEVIVHLYEEMGASCVNRFNGQFAIALWDETKHELFLARDRLGVRPVFYSQKNGELVFGSEIKSLFARGGIPVELDAAALREIFTYWSPLSPKSVFKDVFELPPGCSMTVRDGNISINEFWKLDFTEESPAKDFHAYLDEFEQLLIDATQIRLRADVPVGAYLSGGLDSSVTTAIIQKHTPRDLTTFSITFSDQDFDESPHQQQMVQYLGTNHKTVHATHEDIGRIMPEVIWHTEIPILRTAPAPMFLLSKLVHQHNFKVVLTGEGADEFLAGYDIFKENAIRRFWARDPQSVKRPLLLKKLYPDIGGLNQTGSFMSAFFRRELEETESPFYSHNLRWFTTSRTRRFLAKNGDQGYLPDLPLPEKFRQWSPLGRAQYMEIKTFLSPYLLSSQGDRMAMGNSVEGRYPFLDYRVVEFCNRLPAEWKLNGLMEKYLLKKLGRKLVPKEIWSRVKRPYRAPIHRSFFSQPLGYVEELLSESKLKENPYFEPQAVIGLSKKAAAGNRLSETEDMAVMGILSTQLVHEQFVKKFEVPPITRMNLIKVVDRTPVKGQM